jgi:hypothetical protein
LLDRYVMWGEGGLKCVEAYSFLLIDLCYRVFIDSGQALKSFFFYPYKA